MFAPITKLLRQVSRRGIKGTITQLYTIGDLKFGVLKGVDKFGNHYYEDIDLPYGQHRWVEYADIHNPDPTMIQPDWHGWMHHVYDETPDEMNLKNFPIEPVVSVSDAIYGHHLAFTNPTHDRAQVDTTQYRQRGYKVGSLMTGPDEPDHYYLQPGHALSSEVGKGRFEDPTQGDFVEWDPITMPPFDPKKPVGKTLR